MFDQIYGVGSERNGDCYLQYGIALFELSREESGVLDGVVNAKLKEEEEAEDDEDESGEEGADGEEESQGEDEAGQEETGDEAQTHENGNKEETAGPSSSAEPVAGTSNGEVTESTAEAPAQQEVEPPPTNAEIAWEVLTMARDVFSKTKSTESKLKLAEALQTLGEISLEWENFEAARDLFEESLELKKEVLPEEDRSIAESYYQIGISYSFLKEIERANACFRLAIGVIESKIESLKKSGDESKMSEVKELESLLPDMAAKIEDSRDQMTTSVEVEKMVEDEESRESEVTAKVHNSPSKPINNISHLVKRKRPASTETGNGDEVTTAENGGSNNGSTVEVEAPPAKKLAASNGNGSESVVVPPSTSDL